MKKSADRLVAAQELVEIAGMVPLVLRTITAGLRESGYDIMPAHIRLLTLLASGPCNLSEMARMQAVSLPTMSNSISVLVERGWVKRTHSLHDRRMVLLELTPAGQDILVEIKRQAEMHVAEVLAPLSQDEYRALLAGLAVLRQALAPVVRSELGALSKGLCMVKEGK